MTTKHSIIGASSCKRWKNCSASIELSRKAPNLSSKYAEEGTLAHKYAEDYFNHRPVPEGKFEDGAKEYYDTIMNAFLDADCPSHICLESKVEIKSLSVLGIDKAFGTCDAWFVDGGKHLHIFDYKFGAGHYVEADANEQLMYYAQGVIETFNLPGVEHVTLYIIQPRMDNVSSVTIDRSVLRVFIEECAKAITSPPTFKMGEWCKFCPAKSFCPEQLTTIEQTYEVQLNKPVKHQLKTVHMLDDETLLKYLDNADVLYAWITSVRGYAENYVRMGGSLPGYELQESLGNRKWKDELAVQRSFASFGDAIYSKTLKSPAQLEKLGKGLKDQVDALTTREITGVKLKKVVTDGIQINQFSGFSDTL